MDAIKVWKEIDKRLKKEAKTKARRDKYRVRHFLKGVYKEIKDAAKQNNTSTFIYVGPLMMQPVFLEELLATLHKKKYSAHTSVSHKDTIVVNWEKCPLQEEKVSLWARLRTRLKPAKPQLPKAKVVNS